MRGCAKCAEIEQLLEQTALEYWNVIHKYRGAVDDRKANNAQQILVRAKSAMDSVQQEYTQHLATAHPEPAPAG